MRPFNLTQALSGEAVVCRNGKMVRIAGYNENALASERLVGWVEDSFVMTWNNDGTRYDTLTDDYDLFMQEHDLHILMVKSKNGTWNAVSINYDVNEVNMVANKMYDLESFVHKIVKVVV